MGTPTIEIERIPADTPGFDFETIRRREVPVILTGAMSSWPCMRKWSFGYLKQKLGDKEYSAEVGLPLDVPINYSLDDFQKKLRLDDFLEIVESSSEDRASYITNKSIDRFPGLSDDVDFQEFLGRTVSEELTRLWIGTAGTKSSLHFDYYQNVLCQVMGEKRAYLVDPKFTSCLYQYSSNIDKSKVDVEAPDFASFPKFRSVPIMTGLLSKGDCLVIPGLWWHSLRSLAPSISINCFYGERAGEKELLPMMLAGGPRLVTAFVRDFAWNGMLGRPYRKRLYAAEPFGVWFYTQFRGWLGRKFNRLT